MPNPVTPIQIPVFTKKDLEDENLGLFNSVMQSLGNTVNKHAGAAGPSVLPAGIDVAGGSVTGLAPPSSPTDAISASHASDNYGAAAQKSQLDLGKPHALDGLTLLWRKVNNLPKPTTPGQVVTSNAFAVIYQNTTKATKRVYITISAPGGTAGTATAVTDSSPTPTTVIAQASAQTSGGSSVESMLVFEVLAGNYYEVTRDTSIVVLYWVECSG